MEIQQLIEKHLEIKRRIEELTNQDEAIKAEVKLFLRQNNIDKFMDSSGNSVTLFTQERENIDKKKLADLLTPEQYNNVLKISTFETLKIMSKESRDKASKFIKNRTDVMAP